MVDYDKWRPRARKVAIVDSVLLSILLLVALVLLFYFIVPEYETHQEYHAGFYWESWAWVGVGVLCMLPSILVTIGLLIASKHGQEPKKAITLCNIWRVWTMACLLLSVIGNIVMLSPVRIIITLVWRVSFIYIVHEFFRNWSVIFHIRQIYIVLGVLPPME